MSNLPILEIDNVRRWRDYLHEQTELQTAIAIIFEKMGLHKDFLHTQKMTSYPKFIKDSLWGNIELPPEALSIIQTPYFQKLRHIRKLGLTSLTYPGATHTLLEHSLGNYFLLKKILSNETKNNELFNRRLKNIIEINIYQHACLLAEFGQPPYGEFISSILFNPKLKIFKNLYFANFKIDKLLERAKGTLGISKPDWMTDAFFNYKLTSSIFFLSKTFSEYYNKLWCFDGIDEGRNTHSPSILLTGCLLGFPINDNPHLFYDLFHGPFGVKCIDELVRDTTSCGIRSPLDYERVIATSKLTYEQSSKIEGVKAVENPYQRLLLVDKMDPFAFKEIEMSHELLDFRIQSHPWRVAFQNLFQIMLGTKLEGDNLLHTDKNLDYLKIWSMFEDELLKVYSNSGNVQAAKLAKKLMYRQVPHRCFAVSTETLANTLLATINNPSSEVVLLFNSLIKRLYEEIYNKFSNEDFQNLFIDNVRHEVEAIIERLQLPLNIEDLEIYSVFDSKLNERNYSATGYVISQGKVVRKRLLKNKDFVDKDSVLFFYSNFEFKTITHIAIKKLLYKQFSLKNSDIQHLIRKSKIHFGSNEIKRMRFLIRPHFDNENLIRLCGLKKKDLERTELDLAEKDYYDNTPILYENDKYKAQIENICAKFKSYQGDGEYSISKQSVKYFVQQFPYSLRGEVIQLIQSIEILERNILTNNLIKTMRLLKSTKKQNIYTCPFTQSSGLRMKTNIGKNSVQGMTHCSDIYEVLDKTKNKKDPTILFYDDNLISGSQAIEQFSIWLNLPTSKNESNTFKQVLTAENIEKLKQCNINFSFYMTWEEGVIRLINFLGNQAIKITKASIHSNIGIDSHSGSSKYSKELREYLKSVGEDVYAYKLSRENGARKDDKEFIKSRAMGFDNLEGLIITDSNVPTSTYTALWCPGERGNDGIHIPWKPLFIRNNSFAYYVW